MSRQEVGNRIKESRKYAGYTQKQVAEILNMVQPSYARYEAGKIELDYEKLVILSDLFGVTIDYLLKG